MVRRVARFTLAAFAVLAFPPLPAAAQSAEEFYKGRTVTLIIGFGPGGLNDIAGRLVAQHLPRFIPGHPRVVAQNMPGAGGLIAANHRYNVARRTARSSPSSTAAWPRAAFAAPPTSSSIR